MVMPSMAKYSSASATVQARSAAPMSASSPATRSRARARPGGQRPDSTSRSLGGACLISWSRPASAALPASSCASSMTSTTGLGRLPTAVTMRCGHDEGGAVASSAASSGAMARARTRAASTYCQNRAGSRSSASTVSQAACGPAARPAGRAAAQEAQATVLPAPAGPEMSVTRWAVAASISSVTRRRRSTVSDGRGGRSLSSSSGGSPWPASGRVRCCRVRC
jgi:hypothetical protein